ncbi:MAG: hypothetical protein ABIQ65_13685 [Thermoanaerobaculia bacterium]
MDDEIARRLPERTGRHRCASCLAEVAIEEYFDGDFFCAACAQRAGEYPLATTPHATPPPETKKPE